MPTLKQLTCSVDLSPTNVSLREHNTTYGDGFVETYVAIPSEPSGFNVHLTSSGYIAPGLAMFVYMDGIYQCNRNRRNLIVPDGLSPVSHTEVEFRVRQKEEKAGDGKFIGREWRFEKLNIVKADAAANVSTETVNNIGTIEVVVLRCYDEQPYTTSAPVALPKPASKKDIKAKAASKKARAMVEEDDNDDGSTGGLFGLFDGENDAAPSLDGYLDYEHSRDYVDHPRSYRYGRDPVYSREPPPREAPSPYYIERVRRGYGTPVPRESPPSAPYARASPGSGLDCYRDDWQALRHDDPSERCEGPSRRGHGQPAPAPSPTVVINMPGYVGGSKIREGVEAANSSHHPRQEPNDLQKRPTWGSAHRASSSSDTVEEYRRTKYVKNEPAGRSARQPTSSSRAQNHLIYNDTRSSHAREQSNQQGSRARHARGSSDANSSYIDDSWGKLQAQMPGASDNSGGRNDNDRGADSDDSKTVQDGSDNSSTKANNGWGDSKNTLSGEDGWGTSNKKDQRKAPMSFRESSKKPKPNDKKLSTSKASTKQSKGEKDSKKNDDDDWGTGKSRNSINDAWGKSELAGKDTSWGNDTGNNNKRGDTGNSGTQNGWGTNNIGGDSWDAPAKPDYAKDDWGTSKDTSVTADGWGSSGKSKDGDGWGSSNVEKTDDAWGSNNAATGDVGWSSKVTNDQGDTEGWGGAKSKNSGDSSWGLKDQGTPDPKSDGWGTNDKSREDQWGSNAQSNDQRDDNGWDSPGKSNDRSDNNSWGSGDNKNSYAHETDHKGDDGWGASSDNANTSWADNNQSTKQDNIGAWGTSSSDQGNTHTWGDLKDAQDGNDDWGTPENDTSSNGNQDTPSSGLSDDKSSQTSKISRKSENCGSNNSRTTQCTTGAFDQSSIVKQYWGSWRDTAAGQQDSFSSRGPGRDDRHTEEVYIAPEAPLYSISESAAKNNNVDHQVRPGRGAEYTHKVSKPKYIDTMEKPYAVFKFNYRSREMLQRILKRKVEEDENVTKAKLSSMTKEQLVKELLRARSEKGSKKSSTSVEDEPAQANNDSWSSGNDNNASSTWGAAPADNNASTWDSGNNNTNNDSRNDSSKKSQARKVSNKSSKSHRSSKSEKQDDGWGNSGGNDTNNDNSWGKGNSGGANDAWGASNDNNKDRCGGGDGWGDSNDKSNDKSGGGDGWGASNNTPGGGDVWGSSEGKKDDGDGWGASNDNGGGGWGNSDDKNGVDGWGASDDKKGGGDDGWGSGGNANAGASW